MRYHILYRNVLDYNLNSALGHCFEIGAVQIQTQQHKQKLLSCPKHQINCIIWIFSFSKKKCVYRPEIFKPLFLADNRITSGLKHISSGLESRQVLPDQCHAQITSRVAEGLGIAATEIAIRNMD